jgi:hypothetical protein
MSATVLILGATIFLGLAMVRRVLKDSHHEPPGDDVQLLDEYEHPYRCADSVREPAR